MNKNKFIPGKPTVNIEEAKAVLITKSDDAKGSRI